MHGGACGGRVVSIHAPTGGATPYSTKGRPRRPVSIHAPTGGATRPIEDVRLETVFQFTRPRGARRARGTRNISLCSFNSRAHGGRDPRKGRHSGLQHSFNSRAHGGRDRPRDRRAVAVEVSIHAPTGGATQGAKMKLVKDGFNSRAHGGRDRPPRHPLRRARVSIHAPTGGATHPAGPRVVIAGFQFTRPRGARRPRPTRPRES